MVYTAYSEKEYEELPERYKSQVVGIKEDEEILQVPLCPICGEEMMDVEEMPGVLSCIGCGIYRRAREVKLRNEGFKVN